MKFDNFNIERDLEFYFKGDITAFEHTYPGVDMPPGMLAQLRSDIEELPHRWGAVGITALDENNPIGFVMGSIELDTPGAQTSLVIESIYVAEEFRGLGTAGKLLSKVESWAISKGAKYVQLDVENSNESAITAYLKKGYVKSKDRIPGRKHSKNKMRKVLPKN